MGLIQEVLENTRPFSDDPDTTVEVWLEENEIEEDEFAEFLESSFTAMMTQVMQGEQVDVAAMGIVASAMHVGVELGKLIRSIEDGRELEASEPETSPGPASEA